MVFVCTNVEEAREAFLTIVGSVQYASLDSRNKEALVQEFLEGPEFAIDTVSAGGQHKIVCIWEYHKVVTPVPSLTLAPASPACPFVYAATILRPAADLPKASETFTYICGVLDALGIKHGPTHTEVPDFAPLTTLRGCSPLTGIAQIRMTRTGPALIEVNCRWHDTDFTDLCDACVGYNAHHLALDAFLAPYKTIAVSPPFVIGAGASGHASSSAGAWAHCAPDLLREGDRAEHPAPEGHCGTGKLPADQDP
eukprot:scaffold5020_cov258-Pinguiococcus_pyrenoidosus.AAC.2